MIGEKAYKIRYTDTNGHNKEKWVNEYALFTAIEELKKDGFEPVIVL